MRHMPTPHAGPVDRKTTTIENRPLYFSKGRQLFHVGAKLLTIYDSVAICTTQLRLAETLCPQCTDEIPLLWLQSASRERLCYHMCATFVLGHDRIEGSATPETSLDSPLSGC